MRTPPPTAQMKRPNKSQLGQRDLLAAAVATDYQPSSARNGAASIGGTAITSAHDHPARFPILQEVLPITAARIPAEILAGITLAAIAVPEVMGYTKIAGTPVITGLYTMLIPTALFALFGSCCQQLSDEVSFLANTAEPPEAVSAEVRRRCSPPSAQTRPQGELIAACDDGVAGKDSAASVCQKM
jgi:hypothetical protein